MRQAVGLKATDATKMAIGLVLYLLAPPFRLPGVGLIYKLFTHIYLLRSLLWLPLVSLGRDLSLAAPVLAGAYLCSE